MSERKTGENDLLPLGEGEMRNASQREEVKRLIEMGLSRGYLTFAEVNDLLPSDMTTNEQLDEVMMLFGGMGINVIESPPEVSPEEPDRRQIERGEEQCHRRKARASDGARPRKGSSAPEEREIGKRIEEAVKEIRDTVLHSELAVQEVLDLGEELLSNKMEMPDVFRGSDDKEELGLDEAAGGNDAPLLKHLPELRRLYVARLRLGAAQRKPKLREFEKTAIEEKTERARKKMTDCLREMNLSNHHVERIVKRIRGNVQKVERNEERVRAIEVRAGLDLKGLRSKLSLVRRGPLGAQRAESETGLSVDTLREMEMTLRQAQKEIHDVEDDCGMSRLDLKRRWIGIEAAENRLRVAKNALVELNLGLVETVAKKLVGKGLAYDDLIQEGRIGLMKAVDRFDYRRGRFPPFSFPWIWQAITRAIAYQAHTICVPVHMIETINKLIRTSRYLVQALGREPTIEEVAAEMNVPLERVRNVLDIAKEPVSPETPIGEEEVSHPGDLVEDKRVLSSSAAVVNRNLQEQTRRVLASLTPKEEKPDHSIEEVGRDFEVSREKIRQIEAKALRKPRHPTRSKRLRGIIEE